MMRKKALHEEIKFLEAPHVGQGTDFIQLGKFAPRFQVL